MILPTSMESRVAPVVRCAGTGSVARTVAPLKPNAHSNESAARASLTREKPLHDDVDSEVTIRSEADLAHASSDEHGRCCARYQTDERGRWIRRIDYFA